MKLHVIGSSSAGNGYIFEADSSALVVEAGVPLKAVKRALGYNIAKVAACLVTHEHGDHAGYVRDYLRDTVVPVLTSRGTAEAVSGRLADTRRAVTPVEHGKAYRYGDFRVIGLRLMVGDHYTHDAAEPFCWQVNHPDMGTVLFATDTYCIPYRFDSLDAVLIECNYARDILDGNVAAGAIGAHRRKRIVTSHMSLDNCIHELTHKMDPGRLRHIVLVHTSDDNSDPDRFRSEVSRATGKPVTIATAGMTIDFNTRPF